MVRSRGCRPNGGVDPFVLPFDFGTKTCQFVFNPIKCFAGRGGSDMVGV